MSGPTSGRSPVVADDVQDLASFGSFQSVWNRLRPFFVLGPRFLRLTSDAAVEVHVPPACRSRRSSRPHAALCWAARARAASIGGRAEGLDIQGDAVQRSCACASASDL